MADMKFEDVIARAKDMEGAQAQRNTMFEELENMYLLEASELPSEDWIKETISPDPRNDLQGANRLLTATEPTWSVPVTTNSSQTKRKSSKIETFCAATWDAIGNVQGKPLHYDIGLSALLYGEIQLSITLTKDIQDTANSPAAKAQADDIAAKTPFLIDVIPPGTGYPEFGKFGLRAYLSKIEQTVGDVRDRWGEDKLASKKVTDKVIVRDYYDLTWHCVWAEGEKEPFLFAKHELPFIPIVAVIAEGSRLFYKPTHQSRQPFLYSLWKTNLWKRQNLSLTMMYSLIFSIGANPLYVWQRATTNKDAPTRDYSQPGGLIILDQGEQYQALAKQVLDPSLMTGLATAEQKAQESTIYRQSLGAPLAGDNTFSTISLLAQSGRLPLTSYQRMASFAISKAMTIGLAMAKKYGGSSLKSQGEKGLTELKSDDIPDQLNLVGKLDVSLPQDDRQMVSVAAQATGGDNPLVSNRYAREVWLKIGQSDDMDREIAEEKFLAMQTQMKLQMKAQQMMQQLQGQVPGQIPGQMQGQMQGQVPQQMAGPAGGGLPPEMMGGQVPQDLSSTGAEMGLPGMMAGAPMDQGQGGGMPPGMEGGL